MTRNDFIHQTIISMVGDPKKFSIGAVSSNDQIKTITTTAVRLADAANEVAPFE